MTGQMSNRFDLLQTYHIVFVRGRLVLAVITPSILQHVQILAARAVASATHPHGLQLM